MIVVVGNPGWRAAEPAGPAGRACAIAVAAAANGAAVELVGRAGDDPHGDALMLGLARAGVGHVAILRDPARPTPVIDPVTPDDSDTSVTADVAPSAVRPAPGDAPRLEPADVALGLQYLTAFSVLVVTDDAPPAVLPVAVEAAAYTGAHLVLLLGADAPAPDGLPDHSTVLAVPVDDPDGAFAQVVGAYAAAVDGGAAPADAFTGALAVGLGDAGRLIREPGRLTREGRSADPRRWAPRAQSSVSGLGGGSRRAMSSGPSLRTLFTSVGTGYASRSTSSRGSSRPSSSPGSAGDGSSQRSHARAATITGIRSWMVGHELVRASS